MKKIEMEPHSGASHLPRELLYGAPIINDYAPETLMLKIRSHGTIAVLRDVLEKIERDQADNPGRRYKVVWESV